MTDFRKYTAILILLLMTAAMATPCARGQERKYDEYEVKAVFIYNLAKFVEWPDQAFDDSSTLTLYILGDAPFGNHLHAIKGRLIKGKSLVVEKIDSPDALKKNGILFISSSETGQLRHIVKRLSRRPILTIGDTPAFAKGGVMVNFYIEHNKIRFEINMEAAKQAGLKLSSNLLKMGKMVTP